MPSMPLEMISSFDSFTKLPVDLQHIIWTFTISNPRAISGENCFREWWNGTIVAFLVPAALHVCRYSRFVASRALRRSSLQIPCVPGWRTIYVNQSCDIFIITEREIMNIAKFIADPVLITRVVISKGHTAHNTARHDTNHCFRQLSGLREVIVMDEGELYLIKQQELLFRGAITVSRA